MNTAADRLRGEKGYVFVLALLLLLVATLVGMASVSTMTYEVQVSGNQRISEQAFYVAEAGLNEFMGRFLPGVTGEISDGDPTNIDWKLFLAANMDTARRIGYSENPNHTFIQSLQTELNYGAEISHRVESGKVVTKGGFPVYLVTSHGFTSEQGHKVIQAEFVKRPNMDPHAALYSKAPVRVRGTSSYITGLDQCPQDGVSKDMAGVITTTPTLITDGNPTIEGTPSTITSSSLDLPLVETVDYYSNISDFGYTYTENKTLTQFLDNWGVPVVDLKNTKAPASYTGEMNIVYFNMNGVNTLTLAGQSHGAGLLLVDGNLSISGGFQWYGMIVVTGALSFTGGAEKNVTGSIMAGETATVDSETVTGGNIGIMNCSGATKKLKEGLPPLKMTWWREVY